MDGDRRRRSVWHMSPRTAAGAQSRRIDENRGPVVLRRSSTRLWRCRGHRRVGSAGCAGAEVSGTGMKVTIWHASDGAGVRRPRSAAAEFGTKGGPEPANIDEIAERPAPGPLRHGAADQLRHLQGRLGGPPGAGHPRPGARRRRRSTRPTSTPTARPSTRRASTPTSSWSGSRRRSTCSGRARRSATRPRSASTSARSTSDRSSACASTACRPAEKEALAAFFARINDDYHNRARDTEYHDGEIRYDYLRLNCAKTIGAGFKYGAGYQDLEVDEREASCRRAGWWRPPTPTSPPRWR